MVSGFAFLSGGIVGGGMPPGRSIVVERKREVKKKKRGEEGINSQLSSSQIHLGESIANTGSQKTESQVESRAQLNIIQRTTMTS
jgi:hypothetical protein